MPDILEGYVSAAEYARQRGVTKRWLRQERREGRGAPWVRLGGAVFYPIDGIRE